MVTTRKHAYISPCGSYRYFLSRIWDRKFGLLGFVMLNPSTADAAIDDPTIRRCMRFARIHNFGGIVVTNLYAWRSKDPGSLKLAGDPVGPHNDKFLLATARRCDVIFCAWGAHPMAPERARKAVALLTLAEQSDKLWALGYTKSGQPRHPLMAPKNRAPVKFELSDPDPTLRYSKGI